MVTANLILSKEDILRKTKRMACEIIENNFNESEVVLCGILKTGFIFAQILQKELNQISPNNVDLIQLRISKTSELPQVELDTEITKYTDAPVFILVDDVLNTGRTLSWGLKPFLEVPSSKIQVAVLIDRSHRKFPVSADYIGYSLSTTIHEHISVKLDKEYGVYLN